MKPHILVIGPGKIGTAVLEEARVLGWSWTALNSNTFLSKTATHIFESGRTIEERINYCTAHYYPDCVLVCTPPFGDKGKKEFEILHALADHHFRTVICTKEVLADRFAEFRQTVLPYFHGKFSCNASIGGETGLLEFAASRRLPASRVVIDLAPNASTNFLFSRKEKVSLKRAGKEAERFGFLEPGDGTLREKIDRELLDGVRKGCGFFNLLDLGNGTFLTSDQLGLSPLDDGDIEFIEASHDRRFRLVVTFSNIEPIDGRFNRFFGGFGGKFAGWWIAGGILMHDIDWIPEGPSAALRIREEGAKVPLILSGQGAGERTAHRMVLDAQRLLETDVTLGEAIDQLPYRNLPRLNLRGHPPLHLRLGDDGDSD